MTSQAREVATTFMPDDRLGAIAVSVVVSELRWTPDVAPAVMDRIARDAVAYPEHFGRHARLAQPPTLGPLPMRSASRALGRLAIFGVVLLVIAGLVILAASVNGAEPSMAMAVSGRSSALTADDQASAAPATTEASPSLPVDGPVVEGSTPPASETEWRGSAVQLRLDRLKDGLDSPVYITDDGVGGKDSCLYVVERGGAVRVFDSQTWEERQHLVDISGLVTGYGPEQGLLGLAFHPDFARNGRFFVRYVQANGTSVVAEYKARPCGSVKQGKSTKPKGKIIYKVRQEYPNDNAGWIGFGPKDGYLYVPFGDGGGPAPGDPNGIGQAKSTELAKVLRMDVDQKGHPYAWPKDNPWWNKRKRGFFPGTWAWGLRDPRHASFDARTGDLWIGDVGQEREEIDRIAAGSVKRGYAPNFGWSDIEGDTCRDTLPACDPSAYVAPVYTYDQIPPQRGVTGGYVYRGRQFPALDGIYLFSDLASGDIWGLDADALAAGDAVTAHLMLQAPSGTVSFGQDDDGELYVVSLDGSISRIGADRR